MARKIGFRAALAAAMVMLTALSLLNGPATVSTDGHGTRIGRHDLTIWSVQVDPAVIGPGVLVYPDTYDADKYKNQQTTMDVSEEVPNEGDIVLINLTVFNLGLEEGSAEVEFYDGPREGGVFIGNDTVDVRSLNYDIARTSWDTKGINGEDHEIFAYIIPDDPANETNTDNNQGSQPILINFYPTASISGYSVDGVFGAGIIEGDAVLFDGSPSTDTDRDVDAGLIYSWDFNDPSSNESNPDTAASVNLSRVEHEFGDAGSYTIVLKVTDQHGACRTSSIRVNVTNSVPEPVISPTGNIFHEDEEITFDASSTRDSDHDLSLMEYMWDLGDGKVTGWSMDPFLHHSYPISGKYTVELWARDDEGSVGSVMKNIEVLNVVPASMIERVLVNGEEAPLIEGKIEVIEDDVVDLIGAGSDTRSDIDGLSYIWRLEGGDRFEDREITLSYATKGKRTAELIVTDDDGDSSSTGAVIMVINLPPVADAGEGGEFTTSNIRFDAGRSTDTPSDLESLRYEWDLGDGGRKDGMVVFHTYESKGTYDVTLTVEDDDGETSIDRIRITIENLAPEPKVQGPDRVVEDETFILDAGLSSDPDGEVRSFLWSLPDGTDRTGSMLEHTFPSSGEFIISLVLTDDNGASSKLFWEVLVQNLPPQADAGPDNETVLGEGFVLDGGRSTDTPSDLRNLTYNWTFENGTGIEGKIIEVVFMAAGQQAVDLRVTDPEGLVSIDRIIIWVLGSTLERIDLELNLEPERCGPGAPVTAYGKVAYTFRGPVSDPEMGLAAVNIHVGDVVYRVFPDRNGDFGITFSAPQEPGDHVVRCTITRLGVFREETADLRVVEEPEQSAIVAFARSPAGVASGASVLIIGGGLALAMSTDIGRWRLFLLLIPLFSRIRRDEVLDNFERGRIYQYILLNPGDYFSHIKEMLELNSGTLTYHLKVLEQREFIRSVTDGTHKRFYPYGMRVEPGDHRDIQSMILELLAFNPGMSQKEIARSLGVHVSTVNYHINMMVGAGLLRSDRSRRTQRYEVQYIAQEIPVE
ncbi:MAG: PKD domain-containing protein [Thermoplasmatota archaeon]